MKKFLVFISFICLLFVLVGCNNKEKIKPNADTNESNEEQVVENAEIEKNESTSEQVNELMENENQQVEESEKEVANNSEEKQETLNESLENKYNNEKILIAFFSRADENYAVGTVDVGNTEIMAGFIKDYLGDKADIFKIDPVSSYPANYKECTEVATKELNENARPEFKNANTLDMSKYDTVILGYPIWWGDVPMIINTFLEKYDFSGKTIYLFNTHEGSGQSGTYSSIKNKMSNSNVNTNGLAIRGATAREENSRSTVENWLKNLGL